jgi:hypothetical protein
MQAFPHISSVEGACTSSLSSYRKTCLLLIQSTYAIFNEDRDATLVLGTKAAGANAVADAKRNAAATVSFIFPFSVATKSKLVPCHQTIPSNVMWQRSPQPLKKYRLSTYVNNSSTTWTWEGPVNDGFTFRYCISYCSHMYLYRGLCSLPFPSDNCQRFNVNSSNVL